MNPFPGWVEDLPRVDTPFTGLEGRLLSGPHGQAVFFRAAEEFEVPPHAHGAQWGIVVTGRLHLTVSGEAGTYEPGDTYDVPTGAEHSARLEAGTCVIDVFQEPDRYRAKQVRGEWVDLAHTIEEGILAWPTPARFGRTSYVDYALGDGARHYGMTMSEHTGTHVDAPCAS